MIHTPKQLDFFDHIDKKRKRTIKGEVYQLDKKKWQAELMGGWYIRQGKTKQAAIDAVIKAYNLETKGLF